MSAGREPGASRPGADDRGGRPARRTRGLTGVLRETVLIVGGALVLSLVIKTFLAQAFFIPSASMRDTLIEGDRVVVSKLTPGLVDVARGDVVVFSDPGGWLPPGTVPATGAGLGVVGDVLRYVGLLPPTAGEHLIKRVIAVGGDRVACCDAQGRVTVNGAPLDEPYLRPGSVPSEVGFDVEVPDEHIFVMGDNRQNSQDSRAHLGDPGGGMVPERDIVGKAVVLMWPLNRATIMRAPSSTFAAVPPP